MGMAFFERAGPEGERLAEAAANEVGAAVGFDPEGGITFDSDEHDDAELATLIAGALENSGEDWRAQLRPAE